MHTQIHAAPTGAHATRARPSGSLPERLLLSASEAADLLGMSLRKFHQTRPLMPAAVVIGVRHVRFRRSDLTAWVANLTAADSRCEPPQLALGKAKKRSGGGSAGGLLVGFNTATAETQAQRGSLMSEPPSNSKTDVKGAI